MTVATQLNYVNSDLSFIGLTRKTEVFNETRANNNGERIFLLSVHLLFVERDASTKYKFIKTKQRLQRWNRRNREMHT